MREIFNQKFVSVEHLLETLKPLLGLLPTGYYALFDTEMYPTDGNGRFFWRLDNTPLYDEASRTSGIWWAEYPKYLLPTKCRSNGNI